MILRDYQAAGKALVGESFRNGSKATVLCVPTGGGKTVMFSDIAKSATINGTPVMIMCDRKELIGQANDKLNQFGLFPTLVVPGYRDTVSNLYLASVDTLRNRKFPDVGLLIADEAHKKTFDETVLEYKRRGTFIIGCTATPIRTGKRLFKDDHLLAPHYPKYSGQMGDVYDDMVEPTNIGKLLASGFLVPCVTYGAELDLGDVDVSNNAEGKEYNEKQLFQKFNKPKMYAGVVDKYIELTPNTKAIVFNINVEHSIKQCAEFNLRGIKSAHVDGKMSIGERTKIFKDFHLGNIMVLCNCGVATTGYDEPTIETVVVNRATMSLALWLQMGGRGGRLCPEIGKTFFNIIDMGGNVFKHGFWDEDRTWSLDLAHVSRKQGVAPIRECASCYALIPASSTACKFCNVIVEKREEDAKKLIEAKFVVLDKNNVPPELRKPLQLLTVEELEKYRELKGFTVAWVVKVLLSRGEDDLRAYGKLKGYASAWVPKQLELVQKAREETKRSIRQFISDNQHVDDEYLKDFVTKKLKANHTAKEIEILLPLIVQVAADVRAGLIQV